MAVAPISAKVEGQPSTAMHFTCSMEIPSGRLATPGARNRVKPSKSARRPPVDDSRENGEMEVRWTRKCLSLARDFRDRRRRDDAGVAKSENKPTR